MSNTMNPESMVDVDLARTVPGFVTVRETCGVTIYNGEDDILDNLLHEGWTVVGIQTII